MELTGLVPRLGAAVRAPDPSFPLYVDPSVLENDRVAFNAGSLTTDSIVIADRRLRNLADRAPEVFTFGHS